MGVPCFQLGQTDVNLQIYRGSTNTVLAEARLSVNCNNPHSLRISVRQAPDSSCPISATSQVRKPIRNNMVSIKK